ncbi:MAG: thiamine-phosphate kinase, partial [Myxococcales bacterium]|nr:thiamine-phosphate kinase [Myxococcales bacterium]
MSDEESRVARLARTFGRAPRGVLCGIGDDAAVLAPGRERLVWTVDVQVEGVHFERSWLGLDALGYRAVMAAASDLAAMGARPRAVVAGLVLPPGFSDAALGALARGQARACRELGTAVVGGNLARGGELSVTTSVLGHAARPLLRSGARPGDGVWVAGATGLAGAGLAWLAHA